MIVVGIVGALFAALAVGGVWLRTQDPDELREMGVVLGYKDEYADIGSLVDAQQQLELKRRKHKRTKQVRKGQLKTMTSVYARKHASQQW